MIGHYRPRARVSAVRWMGTHESTRELMTWIKENDGDARWYAERVEVKQNGRIVSEREPEKIDMVLDHGVVEVMPLYFVVMFDRGDFDVLTPEDFRDRFESAVD